MTIMQISSHWCIPGAYLLMTQHHHAQREQITYAMTQAQWCRSEVRCQIHMLLLVELGTNAKISPPPGDSLADPHAYGMMYS